MPDGGVVFRFRNQYPFGHGFNVAVLTCVYEAPLEWCRRVHSLVQSLTSRCFEVHAQKMHVHSLRSVGSIDIIAEGSR